MTTPKITQALSGVAAKIGQQTKTHGEKQQTTPRTGKCTGCGSTKRISLVFQVIACKECSTFMQEVLNRGLHTLKCNNKGAGHTLLSTPEHPYIFGKLREHCTMHRLIQLLTKGFNGPQLENLAMGGNEQIHKEMRKALFIGSVKVAGEKFGFHETQNSTSIDKITSELHMTEECTDLKQMVGSLAQLQEEEEQPPPNPNKPIIIYPTMVPITHRVIQLTPRASYTHKTWDGIQ